MNINYLMAFIETVKQNSISKASKNLHMTQSALSQQLHAVEKSINVDLLQRSNRGVILTAEGEVVVSYAEAIINLYENMLKDLDQLRKDELKEIKIASCNCVGEYLIPCTIYSYKKQHQNVTFSLKSDITKNVMNNIIDCSADVGFIDGKARHEALECINICNNKLVVIYSNKNKAIKNPSILVKELFYMPMILTHQGSGLRGIIEELIASMGIDRRKVKVEMELDTLESIKAAVSADYGISIVPYSSVKKEILNNMLGSLQFDELNSLCNISMIYNKIRSEQPHVKEFIEFVKKFGQETFC